MSLTRRMRIPTMALAVALSLAFCSTQVLAQFPGFQITAPPTGSVFSTGQAVTVVWTGGDPGWLVNVSLIQNSPGIFQDVAGVAGGIPNSGTVGWTFPSNLTCGVTYQFYVENAPRTTWTYGPLFTVICQIPVAIYIKPGSSPAPINPKSNGTIPVAILSSSSFNATTDVDQTSLTFGRTGTEQSLAFCDVGGQDVNGDGLLDLVCHFNTQQAGFQAGDTVGVLMGKTVSGVAIVGTGSVKIVP